MLWNTSLPVFGILCIIILSSSGTSMTSNGIEKQRENPEPIRPLPRLKVLRNTWCSQEDVERAADCLLENNPDLIRDLVVGENSARTSEYFNLAYELID